MGKVNIQNWKVILKLSWPLVIANSFWNLQLTIDRLFLADHSTEALGAAMAVMGVFWVPMALLQQTAAYLATFVAQYTGAREKMMIGLSFWQSIFVSVAGGILVIALIPLADPFFRLVGHPDSLRELEVDYFVAICFSALPTAIVAAVSAFFTGLGKTRVIILINGAGLVANVLFDYLLISGNLGFPALGISGAGIATALANMVAAAYGLFLILNRDNEREFGIYSNLRFSGDLMRRFLKFGVPSGMQWALEGLAFTVFLIIIGNMPQGSAALAASGIAVTIMMLTVLPALGIAQGVSVLVGQHLGDKKPEEAAKYVWAGLQVALLYIIPVAISFILIPEFFMNWFENREDRVLWMLVSHIAPWLLLYVGFFTTFDCMNLVFSFALKGAGDTRFVTLVALTIPWPLMVLPSWLFRNFDDAVYYAWGAASLFIVTQALVFWRRFAGGKWMSMSVINQETSLLQ